MKDKKTFIIAAAGMSHKLFLKRAEIMVSKDPKLLKFLSYKL